MKFTETPLAGAFIINLEQRGDERGWFARFFCQREYESYNLSRDIMQVNTSYSKYSRTLRGLHYQLAPKAEDKVVRCLRGALFDVIVDLRPSSPSFLKHFGIELSAENRTMLYVPKGFAHGFMTLVDDTEAFYLVSEFYSSQHERGLRYNDPTLGIKWPFTPAVISAKDEAHQSFNPDLHLR